MTHRWLPFCSIAALAVAAYADRTAAGEIFKWIDAEGVVHYSDTKPHSVESVETLRLDSTNAVDYDPATDPYSVLAQAERIGDAWSETQLEAQAREPALPAETYADWGFDPAEPYYSTYAPAYPVPVYLPTRPLLRPPRHAPNAARQQADALQTLAIAPQRPHSINSGAHHTRVQQSRDLPLATSP